MMEGSWDEKMKVVPRSALILSISSRTSSPVAESRFAVGSSARTMRGALPLPARELVGLVLQVCLEADRARQLHDPLVLLLLREVAVEDEGEPDVLVDRQDGKQVEGLEDEAEGARAVAGRRLLRHRLDVLAGHVYRTRRRRIDEADHIEQGRLARARGPGHADEGAPLYVEVDALEGAYYRRAEAVILS
jgi:hypothetical protein